MSTDTLATVARLHDATTLLHAFIYFAEEATEEYEAVGVTGRAGYFASRTAAMGPLPTEMVIATFYNFNPDLVAGTMEGIWERVTAETMQIARWRGAKRVLEEHVRPIMTDEQIGEAMQLCTTIVEGLQWAGRPLAAGNAAMLRTLAASDLADNNLVHLWQLVTVLREWRGDAHIGLLVAEPLGGAECTVVSAALAGPVAAAIKATRSWPDDEWQAAVDRLTARGWLTAEGEITETGKERRGLIEHRTNELSSALFEDIGVDGADRLIELLAPANKALLAANYFAKIGRPAR